MPRPVRHNPFPGMNPYLENHWPGVHVRLLSSIVESLSGELPDNLYVEAEERVQVGEFTNEAKEKKWVADVAVSEPWRRGFPPVWSPDGETEGATMVAEPEVVPLVEEVERWLKIRTAGGQLVTVIEVLRPSNKMGEGRVAYIQKTEGLRHGGANLVEIDLLRDGRPTAGVPYYKLAEENETRVIVFRATCRHQFELYRCPLRKRLPCVRVPLRPQDPDVPLDLQPLIDRIYETGRYWMREGRFVLSPPLSPEDAAWAKECLGNRGEEV